VLEALFPGITGELRAEGALGGDAGADAWWVHEGGRHASGATGITALLASRPLLEHAVARRVRALPNVELREGCAVRGLAVADGRVTGVRAASSRDGGEREEELPADLTVDAAGRGSRAPAWLIAAGYPAPPVEEVRVNVAYTTRVFRRAPGDLGGRLALVVAACPGAARTAGVLAMEGDRWIVSLGGYLGDHPPLDGPGFARFAERFGEPELSALVRGAEPLTEPVSYHFDGSVRRRYERCRRFPAAFLVFGDAICSFNPVYGQGLTVAALEAVALRDALARGDAALARRFFRRAAQVVDVPWAIAATSDLRFDGVPGRRGAAARLLNWYLPWLHRAAHRDPEVSAAFLRVANLLAPPATLLAPALAARVLAAALQARRRRSAPRTPGRWRTPTPTGPAAGV
jgi:2-polyprenyl-6-methoxyphenol hydroxylase-like FAD-dependent oxidoreductase